jgi:hypothetical protein
VKVLILKVMLMLLVCLVPTLAATFDVHVGGICSGIAKSFFLVAPIGLVVGSVIGLISRYRA